MVQPRSTTDDRRTGPLIQAYGQDGILRDYVAQGVILLNPDGSIPAGVPLPTGAATEATLALLKAASGLRGGNPTYRAVVGGSVTPYATPTDLFSINGSATKTIIVLSMWMQLVSGAGSLIKVLGIKRSAVNTGTTMTTTAGVALDSTNAAATAVFGLHTAAPSGLGTAIGTLFATEYTSTTAASAGQFMGLYPNAIGAGYLPTTSAQDMRQPIVLRGVAESLNLNMNGVAWPATPEIRAYGVEWLEV